MGNRINKIERRLREAQQRHDYATVAKLMRCRLDIQQEKRKCIKGVNCRMTVQPAEWGDDL